MRAKDVMTVNVVTVAPDADVQTIAQCLIDRRISAVPVVDHEGRLAGNVSQGDQMRRTEADTERRPSWWLELLAGPDERARGYIKSHGLTARNVMTRDVVTVTEDAPLGEVATLLERHRIKRVPVVRDGAIVGIISRANLLHGLIARERAPAVTPNDAAIRAHILDAIKSTGTAELYVNVVVAGGTVQIWGYVASEAEKQAIGIAAETAPGVKAVENYVGVLASSVRYGGWV